MLDYLATDASAYELQKYLSLCGPSVETVEKVGDDYVLDIEITSNRVDMASVYGIAQEALAILPQFGKSAKIMLNPLDKYRLNFVTRELGAELPLHVKIENQELASRFTTVILDNVSVGASPEFMKKRLEQCDVRSINNVVDISNYLMLSLGQPTHMFDYDKIGKATMILRESKQGEKITTLDGKEFELPGGDIVIEDGDGKLIDLCGIMGGENSAVTEDTKRVVLFVQTYDKVRIRRTSMTTGQRSMAATYFEKDLDEERVIPTLVYGLELLEHHANARQASPLQDIYPDPSPTKTVTISTAEIRKVMGVDVEDDRIAMILENLGFEVKSFTGNYEITVPSWRKNDIALKEDIVEEVARVYGYHNLPNTIQPTVYVKQPKELDQLFHYQLKIKDVLKNVGLHEVMNYSMISKELIDMLGYSDQEHLFLTNTISEEIKYLRRTLLPSFVKIMKENEGRRESLKYFEIAKTYIPRKTGLPAEEFCLAIGVNTSFWDLKGILDLLIDGLHIENVTVRNGTNPLFADNMQGEMVTENTVLGTFGKLKPIYKDRVELTKDIYLAELAFTPFIEKAKLLPTYVPPIAYSVIKLDLTLQQIKTLSYAELESLAYKTSHLLRAVELIDRYNDKLTLRFYFGATDRNITEGDAKMELARINTLLKS